MNKIPPSPASARTRVNRCALVSLVVGTALGLVACGGGREEAATTATESVALNVVVRSDDPSVRTSGGFEASEAYLSSSRRILRSTGPAAEARIALAAPRAGFYELYAWWPQVAEGAGEALVTVRHAGGETQLRVDQRSLGGQWNSLGLFELPAGRGAEVIWRAAGAAPVLVDAVRFQYVGEQRPDLGFAASEVGVGLKDHAFQGRVHAHGGTAPYRYEFAAGRLPDGVVLDRATGELSGTPALPGSYGFTVRVSDAKGQQAAQELTLVVEESIDLEPVRTPATAEIGAGGTGGRRRAQSLGAGTTNSVDGLLSAIAATPEGEWRKVNQNLYSDVWAPASLRPLYGSGNPTPSKIIGAWSSFAWDSNRNLLILYGGGHANYRGNDVYLWRASTQMWERGALPSEMVQDALGNWNAIDGADRAPASAHTYDNALFLPVIDRILMVGGAADANGGHYMRQHTATTSRKTGAYLFNPAMAHPDKVGGSTGSHVRRVAPYPEVVGGNMWSNRDMYLNPTTPPPPSEAFVNGCTGSAVEGGKDVAFIRTTSAVYKYTIHDLADPSADTWQKVGIYYNGPGSKAVCSYDAERRILVRTGSQATPFVYWNLATPATNNRDVNVKPADPGGELTNLLASNAIAIADCGLDFDPVRREHKLWCGGGHVWSLKAPETLGATGWTVTRQPQPAQDVPNASVGTGVLGKWKYIESLDVFMALQDSVQGNVWIYKPVGWRMPGGGTPNAAPTVQLTEPTDGASFVGGTPIVITAQAADSDGSIARVEFFHGATKIGEDDSAPYSFTWHGAPVGSVSLSVRAVDNQGSQASAGPITVTVTSPPPANVPPSVSISAPTHGSVHPFGQPIVLQASAADSDGSVSTVEFFRGTTKLGEATTAPYQFSWAGAPLGSSTLTAVATDDDGAQTTSSPVTIQVQPAGSSPTTVVLRRGLDGYAGVAETYLSTYHQNTVFGASVSMQDQSANYSILMRFAIFQSEGGPVPDGATIQSARLSIYKASSYDMNYGVYRMLKPWPESSATWNVGMPGVPWSVAGANGAGSDFAAAADATAAIGFSAGWLTFDLTSAVQQMSGTVPLVNHGWRVKGITGNAANLKKFHTSEYAADPALRPRLEVSFQ
jgi:hypothetical protein